MNPSDKVFCKATTLGLTTQGFMEYLTWVLNPDIPVGIPPRAAAALRNAVDQEDMDAVEETARDLLLPEVGCTPAHKAFAETMARFFSEKAACGSYPDTLEVGLMRLAHTLRGEILAETGIEIGYDPLLLDMNGRVGRGDKESPLTFPCGWIWGRVALDFAVWAMKENLLDGENAVAPWAHLYEGLLERGMVPDPEAEAKPEVPEIPEVPGWGSKRPIEA